MEDIKDTVLGILSRKKLKGDVYIEENRQSEIAIEDGKIEKTVEADSFGAGVRLVKDKKMSFGFFTTKEKNEIENLIERLEKQALIEGYENYSLAGYNRYNNVALFDEKILHIKPEEKADMLFNMEKSIKAYSGQIKYVRDTMYTDNNLKISYVNTEGAAASYEKTIFNVYTSVVASDGTQDEVVDGTESACFLRDIKTEELAKDVSQRAVNLLGGKSLKSGLYNIILSPYVTSQLLYFISRMFFSSNVRKGKSLLGFSKEGDKIASDKVSIADDALLPNHIGGFPADAEGTPGVDKTLVEKGILKTILYDRFNAQLMGKASTGNCVRESFKSLPDVGTGNFYIKQGKAMKDLVMTKEKGIFVNSFMGMHTIDTVSGNFSLGMDGWISNAGEAVKPVKDVLMTGNIKTLLSNVAEVCDDLKFYYNFGSPTIIIKDVQIAGRE